MYLLSQHSYTAITYIITYTVHSKQMETISNYFHIALAAVQSVIQSLFFCEVTTQATRVLTCVEF